MEVWELVARESIRDCISRWNANGDAGRMADMVLVLAPDVEFQAAESEVLHGRDEVLAFLTGVKGDKAHSRAPAAAPPVRTGRYLPAGKQPSIRHFTSNPWVVFESETRARVRTYYQVLSTFGLDHWGRYLDVFEVVDGEWLITERTVTTKGVDPEGWAAVLT
jgi:SnoaL-like protein